MGTEPIPCALGTGIFWMTARVLMSMTFTMPSTFVVVSSRSPAGSYVVWKG